jgi:haloacetate dehalogenase
VWFFLAQPFDLPERIVGADPQTFLDYMLDAWSGTANAFPEEARVEYARSFRDPRTLHAICEEYRAATTLDHEHDEADRGRRRIRCPVLALWSRQGPMQGWYDVLAVWRDWAEDVRGRALDCGHFLPEEAPDETYRELYSFFTT